MVPRILLFLLTPRAELTGMRLAFLRSVAARDPNPGPCGFSASTLQPRLLLPSSAQFLHLNEEVKYTH